MEPRRVPAMFRTIVRVAARALIAAGVLVLALALPIPAFSPWFFHMVYVPIAILSFIIYIGKLLLDTFFYDHYKP